MKLPGKYSSDLISTFETDQINNSWYWGDQLIRVVHRCFSSRAGMAGECPAHCIFSSLF